MKNPNFVFNRPHPVVSNFVSSNFVTREKHVTRTHKASAKVEEQSVMMPLLRNAAAAAKAMDGKVLLLAMQVSTLLE